MSAKLLAEYLRDAVRIVDVEGADKWAQRTAADLAARPSLWPASHPFKPEPGKDNPITLALYLRGLLRSLTGEIPVRTFARPNELAQEALTVAGELLRALGAGELLEEAIVPVPPASELVDNAAASQQADGAQ